MTRKSRSPLEVLDLDNLSRITGGEGRRVTHDVGDVQVWCDQLQSKEWLCAARGPRGTSGRQVQDAIAATRQKHNLGPVKPPKRDKTP